MNDSSQTGDWDCGGWEGAERDSLLWMMNLSFEEKIRWLEEAQDVIASIHGEEAALLPSGSIVPQKTC